MPKFYVVTIDELPGVFFRGLVVGVYKPDCPADMLTDAKIRITSRITGKYAIEKLAKFGALGSETRKTM